MNNRITIYTYKNLEEFNRFYNEKVEDGYKIYRFSYEETKDLIRYEQNIIIDLTTVIYILKNSPTDTYYVSNILDYNENDSQMIVREELADFVLEKFPTLFNKKEKLYDSSPEINVQESYKPIKRKTVYVYDDILDMNKILDYATENNLTYVNFSKIQKISQNIKDNNKIIIDLTSVIQIATSGNLHILYSLEQALEENKDIECTIQRKYVDDVLKFLPLYFDKSDKITDLFEDLNLEGTKTQEEKKKNKLITNLPQKEFNIFCQYFSENLIGHNNFKNNFFQKLKYFITLNTIKKRKIFSVFLYGGSGLGKTEVGRLIKNFLHEDSKLIKINFGNYSSDHALNNLIGSPNGYIGCDGGELSKKLEFNTAGVVVFDEFEKANRPVFDFFLELLEDGSYTDSMSREYNLDGYILVFTSNIINKNDIYNKIPPEFISRCDLFCCFDKLNSEEREIYIDFQIKNFVSYIRKFIPNIKINDAEILDLKANICNSTVEDLRTLKKIGAR